MRIVWTLFKNNLNLTVKKKFLSFLVSIVAPVAIVIFMSQIINISSGQIKLGVIDNDKSVSSQIIIDNVKENEECIVTKIDEDEVENNLVDNSINVVLIIPDSFEHDILNNKNPNVTIKAVEGNNIYKAVEGNINIDIKNLKDMAYVSNGDNTKYQKLLDQYVKNSVDVKKASLNDIGNDYMFSTMFTGFLMLFMFMKATSGLAQINEDKMKNIYTRIFIAPVKEWQYYLANILSVMVSLLAQIILSLLGIKLFGTINLGVTYIQMFIILSVASLIAVSIGVLCNSLGNAEGESSILSNAIVTPFLLLGGAFVPVDFFPDIINKISYFTPVRWLVESIISLQNGMEFKVVVPYLGIALLFAVAFFVVGAYVTAISQKKYTITG